MNTSIKKAAICSLVALTAAATFASAPAQAKPFPIPKPIPFPFPFPKPMPKPVPKGLPHGHHGFGGWGAAGLVGGLALGAIAASNYECGTVRQAVVDEYGDIVGYRYVPAC